MKLFIIAAIITLGAAARLEHLEQQQNLRAYLPPHQNSQFGHHGQGSTNRPFGAIAGAYGRAGPDQPAYNTGNNFPAASNRYLAPPNYKPTPFGSETVPQFSGSINGIDAQESVSRQSNYYNQNQRNTYKTPSRFQPQSNVNRQYLAPQSPQNIPQQPFDEQTGYIY